VTTTLEPTDRPTGEIRRSHRIVAGVVAGVLVLVSTTLPIWRSHLIAPQYPGGLHIYAHGHGMEGDIEEVDALNHYIGMRPFDPADVPEMALYPLGIALAIAAIVVATFVRHRWTVLAARAYLFALPLFILADIQFRLYQYGHDLDPQAALRIPEFTPWVIGPTRVWNFTNVAYPGTGMIALIAAAVIVSFGPWLMARAARAWAERSSSAAGAGAAATSALLLVVLAVAPPVGAADHSGHDHSGHDTDTTTTTTAAPATRQRSSDRPSLLEHTGSGPLHELVLAARPGDTIVVPEGFYGGNVVIDVPVTLIGEGRPTIHGTGSGSTLVIRAPGTTVTGFRIVASGPGPVESPSGVRIEADDVRLEDNVVEDAYTGIAVLGATRVHLVDNTIIGRTDALIADDGHAVTDSDHSEHTGTVVPGRRKLRGDGISLWDVDGVLVRGNTVNHARDGIYISFGTWVMVDSNVVRTSRYAIHTMYARDLTLVENRFEENLSGAVLMYGGPALVLRNTILENRSPSTGFGVIVKDVVAVEAVENVIARNRVGIHLEGPSQGEEPVRAHRNTIASNQIGATLPPSARGTFSANSFVDNLIQIGAHGVGSGSHVEWTEHGWGNYWSNYQGTEGLAGRGTTPHHEGSRVDGIIERSPLLMSLAGGPGMRLIRSIESHRFAADPVVVDPIPLIRPVSPALTTDTDVDTTDVAIAGLGLALIGGLLLAWLHVPHGSLRRRAPA
jgi:parallel beta-helix repeat protein